MTESTDTGFTGLAVLFAVSLATAQFLAAKVVAVPLPFDAPVVGAALVFPAGFFAYGLTYFATDCINEVYGVDAARRVVTFGFVGLVGVFVMAWVAIWSPVSPAGVGQDTFVAVVGSSSNIIVGGITAYAVSQFADVALFDRLRSATGGRYLWVRNIGSTATSQALDTVVFVGLAFYVVPHAFGVGNAVPAGVVVALIAGQYVVKVVVAVIDTPFVYLVSEV